MGCTRAMTQRTSSRLPSTLGAGRATVEQEFPAGAPLTAAAWSTCWFADALLCAARCVAESSFLTHGGVHPKPSLVAGAGCILMKDDDDALDDAHDDVKDGALALDDDKVGLSGCCLL